MHFLLDENLDENLVKILEGLGHQATHVSLTEHRSKGDTELVSVFPAYDVFLTLDLFRQEQEWLAVHRALMDGEIKVVRVRLPKPAKEAKPTKGKLLLDVVRSLTLRMEIWLEELGADKCFITISSMGEKIRCRTRAEVREILENRPFPAKVPSLLDD